MSDYDTTAKCQLLDESGLAWKNPDVVEATFTRIDEEQVNLVVDCPFCSGHHDVWATVD